MAIALYNSFTILLRRDDNPMRNLRQRFVYENDHLLMAGSGNEPRNPTRYRRNSQFKARTGPGLPPERLAWRSGRKNRPRRGSRPETPRTTRAEYHRRARSIRLDGRRKN